MERASPFHASWNTLNGSVENLSFCWSVACPSVTVFFTETWRCSLKSDFFESASPQNKPSAPAMIKVGRYYCDGFPGMSCFCLFFPGSASLPFLEFYPLAYPYKADSFRRHHIKSRAIFALDDCWATWTSAILYLLYARELYLQLVPQKINLSEDNRCIKFWLS